MRRPFARGFQHNGWQTSDFDYRFLRGNIRPDIYLPITVFGIICYLIFSRFNLEFARKFQTIIINYLLVLRCRLERPEMVFVDIGQNITKEAIIKIKNMGILTVNWVGDPIKSPRVWVWFKEVGPHYDVLLPCEEGMMDYMKKLRWPSKIIHMLAASDDPRPELFNLPRIYNITFVGTYNPDREKYLEAIKDFGLHIWGYGWEKSKLKDYHHGLVLDLSKLLKIYAQTKIVFATTQSPYISVNNRVFEGSSVKAMILNEYNKYMHLSYNIGKEIISFKNKSEVVKLVEYYLTHDKERIKIAEAGYRRTIKDHLYKKRIKDVLRQL